MHPRLAVSLFALSASLFVAACGAESDSSDRSSHGSGSAPDRPGITAPTESSSSSSTHDDVVIVYSSDGDVWTRLDNLDDSHGLRLTNLEGSNLLGGPINPDGTLLVPRDPSSSRMNPVLDVNMNGNGNVVSGDTPTWNASGTWGALNGSNETLQFVDKSGAFSVHDQPQPGTYLYLGEPQPFALGNLEFDDWITADAMLVHGYESNIPYGPFVGTIDDGKFNLKELSDLNPNEIFFNGHDGTYVQVDGTVGRMDPKTAKLESIGHVTPTPDTSYTSISVAWAPDGKAFVFDADGNVVAGTTLCKVETGVSCESVDAPRSERDGSTTYVWTRDGSQFVINTLYSDGETSETAIEVVDADTRKATPLAFHCTTCWVVGFMSRKGLIDSPNTAEDVP